MSIEQLKSIARSMLDRAYCPYSHFPVGAALECSDGTVYTGCNVENAAYSPTLCAERVAFGKAVSEGQRDFKALAVCGGKGGVITALCTPCGVCRQVMAEFCKPNFAIYMANQDGYEKRTLAQLLPDGFSF